MSLRLIWECYWCGEEKEHTEWAGDKCHPDPVPPVGWTHETNEWVLCSAACQRECGDEDKAAKASGENAREQYFECGRKEAHKRRQEKTA